MIVKRVKLHNIRSYEDEEVIFPKGIVLLSGDIGAGKTTLLLALEFALFGTKSDLSANSLLRKGKRRGYVEVEFEIDGKDVIVKRKLKLTKDRINQESGTISINGAKKELAPVELKTEILNLLGYPSTIQRKRKSLIYRFTVYTPQGEMKKILFEKREERLDILRKLFGIDKYKRIKDNSTIILNNLRLKIRELEVKSEGIEELEDRIKEIKKEIEEIKKDEQRHEKNKRVLNEKINELNNELLKLRNEEKELNRLKETLSGLKSRLIEKRKNIEALNQEIENSKKSIYDLKRKLEPQLKKNTIEEDIEVLEGYIRELNRRISESKTKLSSLKNQEAELKKEIKDLELKYNNSEKIREEIKVLTEKINKSEKREKRREVLNKINQKNTNEIAVLKDKISEINENKDKLKEVNECPLCLQPITEKHRREINEKYEKKRDELRKKLSNLVEQNKLIEKEMREIEQEKIEADRAKIKRAELIKQLEFAEESKVKKKEKEEKLARIREEIKDLDRVKESEDELAKKEKRLRELKDKLNKIYEQEKINSKIKELENVILKNQIRIRDETADVNEIKKNIGELLNSINRKKTVEEKLTPLEEKIESIKNEYKEEEISLARLRKERELKEDMKKESERELKKKKECREELSRVKALKDWINSNFLPIIELIEKQVMLNIHTQFNELFQGWFDKLMDDEGISARLSEDFSPIITQNGYDIEVENLSGGEKTALALAYRLALNKVVNELTSKIKTKDLIILDEPTEGFSEKQLDRVKEVIRELNMRQVIIVSHEAKVETFVDSIIKIVKNNGSSQVIKV